MRPRPRRKERHGRGEKQREQDSWRWLWGRHAVEEALHANPRNAVELWILTGSEGPHIRELVQAARGAGAKVRWGSRAELDRLSHSAPHQGLALKTAERATEGFSTFLEGIDEGARGSTLLVALDQIQDPHNLGAIARSAVCLGAKALLVPERRTSPVTQVAVQASAGAIERIPVFTIGNLAQTLEKLKKENFWIYGADMSGEPAWKAVLNFPMVLVIGSEGYGMRPLVRERCDQLIKIPQSAEGVSSLNASCAASVLLYEAARRLRGPSGAAP